MCDALRVCLHACWCACVTACTATCMYVMQCVHQCMYVVVRVKRNKCIYIYIYICMCVCKYIYIYIYVCIYMCVYVYVCIYIYTYIYIYIWKELGCFGNALGCVVLGCSFGLSVSVCLRLCPSSVFVCARARVVYVCVCFYPSILPNVRLHVSQLCLRMWCARIRVHTYRCVARCQALFDHVRPCALCMCPIAVGDAYRELFQKVPLWHTVSSATFDRKYECWFAN